MVQGTMKTAEYLVNDLDKSFCWIEDSDCYLDIGVKTERFHEDGWIEIKK
jgi:hypothetical protein